ncbi:ribonuclease P protein component [Actinomadura rupiterrae]|uniref:ribonuclease P protein component n=1 Tax=Actinomadura rupiterrae TaxID=559627 RepID=UPI0027E2A921|nr:ribonuclease P protein component [Actinomadura rupiterrae]
MLPSGHRMRRRDDFTLAVRRGRRAGRPTVVVHLLRGDASAVPSRAGASRGDVEPGRSATGGIRPVENRPAGADDASRPFVRMDVDNSANGDPRSASQAAAHQTQRADAPALVGFIVARTVGNAVVRNQVRRRLRHLVRARLDRLPGGSLLVVRANPAAGTARGDELAADLDSALDRVLRQTSKGRT